MPVYHSKFLHRGEEFQILRATGHHFADGKIMRVETPTGVVARVFVLNGNQADLPSLGKDCRFGGDSMGVVSEGLMENRALANRTIDQDGVLW